MTHIIHPGDTLYGLSKRYGVSLESLMSSNGILDPTKLEVGQPLRIPTASAGALPPTFTQTRRSRWTHIVVHHSATREGSAQIFDRDHRKRGFWNGLGYHFVIGNGSSGVSDGQVQVGDRWIKQLPGAHCNVGDMNEVGIGICLVGDFENGQRVSARQFDALLNLVRSLQKTYNIPARNVVRHTDVKPSTECPGRYFPWRDFRASIFPEPGRLFLENPTPLASGSSGRGSRNSSFYL